MSTLKLTKSGSGIVLHYREMKLAFDVGLRTDVTLISHAHADHVSNLSCSGNLVATAETLDTLAARGEALPDCTSVAAYDESVELNHVRITALNAGHVLGSAMFLLEFDDGLRVLYTGDYNAVDSVVHRAARPVHADVLITEATYGSPEWVFPERGTVHKMIIDKARAELDEGRIPLFKAYSLGKAQEAIAVLHRGGLEVLSGNRVIDDVSDVYSRHGVDLRYVSLDSAAAPETLERGCAIVSSSPNHTYSAIERVLGPERARNLWGWTNTYTLSGWALREVNRGGFPLSAHTDFRGLMEFTEAVAPRITYCFAGNAGKFSSHLSMTGFAAVSLE
jgi:putative mRNA 3-end processing factor